MFETWKLKKRLDSMENTLQRLQDGFQQLELEWINAYAKLRKIAGRIIKETSRIESQVGEQNEAGNGEAPAGAGPTGPGLTPHQRAIQQQVLRRRGGLTQ